MNMKTVSENESKHECGPPNYEYYSWQESKPYQKWLNEGLTDEEIAHFLQTERLKARTSPLPLSPLPCYLETKQPEPENEPENEKPKKKSEVSIKHGWFKIQNHTFYKPRVTYYDTCESDLFVAIYGLMGHLPLNIKFKTKEDLNKFKKLMY